MKLEVRTTRSTSLLNMDSIDSPTCVATTISDHAWDHPTTSYTIIGFYGRTNIEIKLILEAFMIERDSSTVTSQTNLEALYLIRPCEQSLC